MGELISLSYGAILALSLVCMVLCDLRWRLTFFRDARRATLLCAGVVAAFLLWDVLGIVTGSFFRGSSPYMSGVELGPEMPVEEPFFLFFLCYLTLNLLSGTRMLLGQWVPQDTSRIRKQQI